MKKLYWRPSGLSRVELLLIAMTAIACLLVVEHFPREQRQPYYAQKLAAARHAKASMDAIRKEKLRRGLTVDPEVDPASTGMIGNLVTLVTSNTGHLPAKLTTTNPNFAAVVVQLLRRAGVEQGSVVAVGLSGSFPALNVALYSALHTVKAEPIIIASAASSEWGATDADYLWLDMEETLFKSRLISFRATAASRGGIDDRGFGITKEGRALLDAAIARAGMVRLEPQSLEESIEMRMNIYLERTGDRPIAAYVNVGGGSASVGTSVGKHLFKPGLNRVAPRGITDSVMSRFVQDGVPVIHLSGIKTLATRYGLPYAPRAPQPVGRGGIYVRVEYNPWYALASILIIGLTMLAFLRVDIARTVLALSGRGVRLSSK